MANHVDNLYSTKIIVFSQSDSDKPFYTVFDGNTIWRVIFVGSNFRGKSEKALKIIFRGFKFRDSNQSRGAALLHKR